MKTRKFYCGDKAFTGYFKTVGQGWEVGVTFGGKNIFVGNFIHRNEATAWWTRMCKEIGWFVRTHKVFGKTNYTFYGRYLTNYLYKCYYTFLDKCFAKYTKTFRTATAKDTRKYNNMKRHFAYRKVA